MRPLGRRTGLALNRGSQQRSMGIVGRFDHLPLRFPGAFLAECWSAPARRGNRGRRAFHYGVLVVCLGTLPRRQS
jgi:hypothetical protein